MRKTTSAPGTDGTIDVCDPATGRVLARVLWFGDPWTGDWEWEIRPNDADLRRRLDECYTTNLDRYDGIDFGSFSGRTSPAWTSFEGTFGALALALPGSGLAVGGAEFPEEALQVAGDVTFDLYAADASDRAEAERLLLREQRLWGWEAAGEEPPPIEAADAGEDVARAALDAALETEV